MSAVCYLVDRMEREAASIARGLRRRDPEMLDHLIEQYQHRLLRYLVSLVHERGTAEDLFQETWMRVLEQGHRYDGRRSFVTWLLTVARNIAIDHLRRKRPESLDDLPQERTVDAARSSAFDQASQQERALRVGSAMERLATEQRETILLRFQEGLSLEEISQVTGAPLSTVKSRLYRGMEALSPLVRELKP
jgi:RNA polymerase sigma-70 factor (ECF subfamily)